MNGIQNFALVVLSFLLTLLLPALPSWLILSAVALGLWKWWILRTGQGQPPRLLLLAIGALLICLILLDDKPLVSRESMISLVSISSLLFCLDKPHSRQVMLVHSSFFGLLVSLLVMRSINLPLFLYFFLTILIFFSLMLHHLPTSAIYSLWPMGGNILKISLPVSAILLPIYFFFPEFRQQNAEYAVSGMSDILEPGRIAKLVLSDRLAFRVRFLQEIPAGQSLYWRSAVLEDSYGMIWRKNRNPVQEDYQQRPLAAGLQYEMFTDTRLGANIPLLEHTLAIQGIGTRPSQVWWQPHLRVFQTQNDIIVVTAAPHDRFVARDLQSNVELKIQISERVQGLVDKIKILPAKQQVTYILDLMKSFSYTLNPGTLKRDDALDDFLFERQQGFCEHFAAAFASLLQLAGTPARVVTGYQGGTFIGNSDFMIVRDSDAHAWTEVLLDGRWQRIDPSSVARNESQLESKQLWITALPSAWAAYWLRLMVLHLREWTEQFEYIWMGIVAILAIFVPLQIWRMQKKRQGYPIWQRSMDAFLMTLQRRGLIRDQHEGMRDFLFKVSVSLPELQEAMIQVSELYHLQVYGPQPNLQKAQELKNRFRQLRLLLNKSHSN